VITRLEVIESVGRDSYALASLEARKLAPGCGMQSQVPETSFADQIERKITELLENSRPETSRNVHLEEVALVLELYEELPCYHFLAHYQHVLFDKSADEVQSIFWRRLREFANSEDESLSAPAVYFLWVDLFESPATVQEAWRQMLVKPCTDLAIGRLLKCAGPVPCKLKFPFYDLLLSDKKWHAGIFESLYFSEFEYFGRLDSLPDRKYAREILAKLDSSGFDKDKLDALRQSLELNVRAPARDM
jgi:hypothetical protein